MHKTTDFYLWGSLKDKVYDTNHYTLEELRTSPLLRFEQFLGKNSRKITCSTRYTECIWSGGIKLQHLLQQW